MTAGVAESFRDTSSRLGWRALAALRAHLLAACGVGTFAVGAAARYLYILVHHHPRGTVVSDAMPTVNLAEVLADPLGQQQFFHTIWPPGTSALLGLTLVFDPTLGLAAWLQCLASIAIPPLALLAARWAYGASAGWVALILASLHFGLIHYGGFFLAEQLFQLTIALAVCATIAAIRSPTLLAGVAAGSAWALASLFRPNAIPIALFTLAWMTVRWYRRKALAQHRRMLLAGLGAALVLALPMVHRCSSLLGRFCPGSSNFAMNVALGHAPAGVSRLTFTPQSAELSTGPNSWTPPARIHLGYTAFGEVPGSIYDTRAVLGWVLERLRDDPAEFVLGSLGNAIDLFGSPYWPDDYADLASRRVLMMKQAVFVFILVPGLAFFGLLLLRVVRRRDVGDRQSALLAMLLGLFLLSCASLGEPRYRLPFDLVFILFAARAFTRALASTADAEPAPVPPRAITFAAPALLSSCLLLLAVAHPQLRLAARLRGWVRPSPPPISETIDLRTVSAPRPAGTAWDAPGNHLFSCRSSPCEELRVALPSPQTAGTLEVSADHNDRYLATFYRANTPVGEVAWGIFEGGPLGLRVTRLTVPAAAQVAGFDAIGVRPLYGDGRYAVGHVALSR